MFIGPLGPQFGLEVKLDVFDVQKWDAFVAVLATIAVLSAGRECGLMYEQRKQASEHLLHLLGIVGLTLGIAEWYLYLPYFPEAVFVLATSVVAIWAIRRARRWRHNPRKARESLLVPLIAWLLLLSGYWLLSNSWLFVAPVILTLPVVLYWHWLENLKGWNHFYRSDRSREYA